jgi:hypothetical protein
MTPKYRPILFSIPMVQAILEGKKTQTRRTQGLEKININPNDWNFSNTSTDDNHRYYHFRMPVDGKVKGIYLTCPYNVGDVLWARETFYKCVSEELKGHYYYKASIISSWNFKWIPSIHMPKEAARIFLKIKSIRVERLQDISEADAIQEGVKDSLSPSELKKLEGLGDWKIPSPFQNHQLGFLAVWCSIYKCENWLENPFVWVYEFERIEKPNDFII